MTDSVFVQEDDAPVIPTPSPTQRRQAGREAPAPMRPKFTFPDSRVTVELPRVGPDTLEAIQVAVSKAMPPPPVPQIQIGDAEDAEFQPNPQDPQYLAAVAQHRYDVQFEIGQRLFKFAILQMGVTVDAERLRNHVASLEAIGVPVPEFASEREAFIRLIALSSKDDIAAMMAYLMKRDVPAPEEVQAVIEAFRN